MARTVYSDCMLEMEGIFGKIMAKLEELIKYPPQFKIEFLSNNPPVYNLLPKVQEILKQNMENRGVGREGSPIASEKQGPRCLSPDNGGAALYIVIWIFSTESIFRHCGPPKLFARALLARARISPHARSNASVTNWQQISYLFDDPTRIPLFARRS